MINFKFNPAIRIIINAVLLISFLFLTSCGSNELTKPLAIKLIKEHYNGPLVDDEMLILKYHGSLGNKLAEFKRYQEAGLLAYRVELYEKNYGMLEGFLTKEGCKYLLGFNGEYPIVKVSERILGEINGIISSEEQKQAKVEFTLNRVNVTPFGKMKGYEEESEDAVEYFILYDDGWRIDGQSRQKTFNSPSQSKVEEMQRIAEDILNDKSRPNNDAVSNTEPYSQEDPAKFRGAWFEINKPPGFVVIPSLKSTTAEGYESAFFQSPDKQVEFYIFSPQWNGNPADITLDPSREKQLSSESKSSGMEEVTWYSIKANDNSYTRAYQDTKSKDGSTRWVVGLKYVDQISYDKYKQDYINFKKSLIQFSD